MVRRSASHAVLDALRPILSLRRMSVTWCVAQRFCDASDVCLRLKSPFRLSATYFDGAKVGKSPGSVSGPTSSGS
ncbi:hypothetical protein ALQ36_00758, partial [Pseudomonas syringae pv. primulae]